MRKIAIIHEIENYTNYDDYSMVISSITDWAEVSDEDYKVLHRASYSRCFKILEQPTDVSAFIKTTVAEYLEEEKRLAEEEEKRKKKRAEEASKRKHAKELKDRDSKLKLLKSLQEELGIQETKV